MQARYRSSGDGFRSGSSYRNFQRGGSSRPRPKQQPLQHPSRKVDILMEAGRLAAEYLVSKGMLPPNSLHGKCPSMPEGRTSAIGRLGSPFVDAGHMKRRYDGEDDNEYHYMRLRGKRRSGPYNRGYGSEWSSRENGRRGAWMGRGRRYPDSMDDDYEEDDDVAPGFGRVRRGGFDEAGSSISRVSSEERHSRSEATGESGPEVGTHEMADDTGSKFSASSSRKDPSPEADLDENKVMREADDVKVLNSEAIDEVKSYEEGELENMQETDMEVQPCAVEGDPGNKHDNLSGLCSIAEVPTNPHFSPAHQSPAFEVTAGEDTVEGSMDSSHANQTSTFKCQASDNAIILPDQPVEESLDPQYESGEIQHESIEIPDESAEIPPGFGASKAIVDQSEETSFSQHVDKTEGIEIHRGSSPPNISQENEHSLQNSVAEKSSPCIQKLLADREIVEAADHRKSVDIDAALFPKAEHELNARLEEPEQGLSIKLEEDKQLLPTYFDLNLTGTPEITDIPDDPVSDNIQTSAPGIENAKEVLVDFGLSIGNNCSTDNCSQPSGDSKAVPVINLEDDSPMEDNACNSSKIKNETIYSNLDNFLSQTAHTDLPGIQDGYSLAFSDFLGADISGCPSVPADLNNLQTTMSLHEAEGVPGVDDSIYESFGEIPISFMEVWDQPSQDYGKFF